VRSKAPSGAAMGDRNEDPLELDEIAALLEEGRVWEAALEVVRGRGVELGELAEAVQARVGDVPGMLDLLEELVAPPRPPGELSKREQLLAWEAMRRLVVRLSHGLLEDGWREVLGFLSELAGPESTYRVREELAGLLAAMATRSFREGREVWAEMVASEQPPVAAVALRGLALSQVPAPRVLDLFEAALADSRMEVRRALGPEALRDLGRRDPDAVYKRLRQWASHHSEIARWNIGEALSTVLGGFYVERAMEILEILAADERAMVWKAAARALSRVAQRRPSFVYPVLAKWREDPKRFRCAELALRTLARR